MQGRFVVVEGIDGSGKSTQVKLLQMALEREGLRVFVARDPSRGIIGEKVRQRLSSEPLSAEVWAEFALWFTAARMESFELVIRPALAAHDVVLADRYIWSGYVQGVLTRPPELPREAALEYTDLLLRYAVRPDLTVLLDLPAPMARERIVARGGEATPRDLDERLLDEARREYLCLARAGGWLVAEVLGRSPDEVCASLSPRVRAP